MIAQAASPLRDALRATAWCCLLCTSCEAEPHDGHADFGASIPVTVHVWSECGTVNQVYLDEVGGDGWVSLTESGSRGVWDGVATWRGSTDILVQGWPLVLYSPTRCIADGTALDIWPANPKGELHVQVAADPESFPIRIFASWNEARIRGYAGCGTIERPGDVLDVGCLPPGDYVLTAVPAKDSPRARDGKLVAIGRASLMFDGEAKAITLVDDSRWFSARAVDEQGAACAGIDVTMMCPDGIIASAHTGADGRCSLRVVGEGPFQLWARGDNPPTISDSVSGAQPAGEIFLFTMRPLATLDVELHDGRASGPQPVFVRLIGQGLRAGLSYDRDLRESAGVLPIFVEPGDWLIEVLDEQRTTIAQRSIVIDRPIYQVVDIDL